MAAIFDFNGNARLGRKRNLYQGGGRWSNMRRGVGVGVGSEDYACPESNCYFAKFCLPTSRFPDW